MMDILNAGPLLLMAFALLLAALDLMARHRQSEQALDQRQ